MWVKIVLGFLFVLMVALCSLRYLVPGPEVSCYDHSGHKIYDSKLPELFVTETKAYVISAECVIST